MPAPSGARVSPSPRRPLIDPGRFPLWARWNDELERPYTLGLEEEVMLLDPTVWSLSESSDRVLPRLSDELSSHAAAEPHAAAIELVTGIHPDAAGAVEELAGLRRRLQRELQAMGLLAAGAGMHPLTVWSETRASSGPRSRSLEDSTQTLALREPTMALHVHVGIPRPEDALRVLNGLRRSAPIILALSANSPFWQGRDGGFASSRTLLFGAFPRTGLSRRFSDYQSYVATLEPLIASRAVPGPSFVWWDVRLAPALGTVEMRVMDAQSTVRETAPILALVQSLARLELEGEHPPADPSAEVLAENLFLAARDGMAAEMIDPLGLDLVPVRELLDRLLADCRPHACALGCADELDQLQRLAAANGADRQRAFARGRPLDELVPYLAERFLAPAWPDPSPGSS